MSQVGSDAGGKKKRIAQIPSILSSSLRVVFDAFGENIIALRAHGSLETTNGSTVEGLGQYGLTREQQTHYRLALNYEQIYSDGKPANSLDQDTRQDILSKIESILKADDQTVKPDLTVTSLTIRVADTGLQEVTPAQSPEFDLTFVADPAEAPVRELTKRRNAGRGLYSELGFNLTNLNLRSVIETETKFHEQSNGHYLSWGGPDDVRPRAPDQLSIRINQRILPDEYGILKPYTVADDSILEIVEADVDDPASQSIPEGGDV